MGSCYKEKTTLVHGIENMAKNKGFVLIDPVKDKTMFHVFNDLIEQQTVVFDYDGHEEAWGSISRKIGVRCKKLMGGDDPLFYPTGSARYHKLGFITRPKNVKVIKKDHGKQKKFIFSRKIF